MHQSPRRAVHPAMRWLRFLAPALLLPALVIPAAADPPPAEPPYPLDTLPREVPGCPKITIAGYGGEVVKHSPTIWVNADFQRRLRAFELVVRDVAVEVYGRAPARILNLGGYACRRMRKHADWLSEHALGNAIDVEGFDFGRLPKGAALPAGLAPALGQAFEVRLVRHWGKKSGPAAVHARFLRTLALRLMGQRDVFRVLLGPGYPGHETHFHFDMATFRLVQIFEDGELLKLPRASPPVLRKAPEPAGGA
jgi:hypothetical protein